ncbi:sensor histidine kinase [Clostridium mediterraneense]|uniref:sensor histidine kinase n=1 Tax=Clostridium mediterraneense TaxID=1805472 RepID=UPI000836DA7B|nr:HAMP domain-containing sensor histidine kinase [Clostridium mediterraneense]
MRKLKLFTKTYLFTMILISIIILICHILIYMLLPISYTNRKQAEVKEISEALVAEISGKDEEEINNIIKDYVHVYRVYIYMNIRGENKLFQGMDSVDIDIHSDKFNDDMISISDICIDNSIDSEIIMETDVDSYININIKNPTIIRKEQFNTLDGDVVNLKLVMDLESLKETRDVIFMLLPYTLVISLLISLIVVYIYARKITSPIKKICEVTKEMELLNNKAFCEIETDDEIGELAGNINSLYERLLSTIHSLEKEIENVGKSEKMKGDFLRGASHELKTPLMSIHIMIENMLFDIGKYKNHYVYLEKCKDVVEDLSNMVQEILDTSRFNNLSDKKEEEVDLSEILEETIKSYKLIAKSKNIDMTVDTENSFIFKLNKTLFTKALSNIISNAIKYTDEYKKIRIYFKDKSLVIENECIPIPKEHLENIFKAFYRAEFDRNKNSGGNGLGLYIVRQILLTHKLPFSFEAIQDGMRFTIFFET